MLNFPTLDFDNFLDSDTGPSDFSASVFDLFSFNLNILDLNGKWLECNDTYANCIHLDSRKDVIGMDYYDLAKLVGGDVLNTEQLFANNAEVVADEKPKSFLEYIELYNKPSYFISQKAPLRNREKRIIGVACVALDISDVVQANKSLKTRIKQTMPQANFTPPELEYLKYCIRGYTNKTIAQKLAIPHHLVNDHMKSIHLKSDCNNKEELLIKLLGPIFNQF